ncbi:hypothetical protein GCM10023185_37470 [Hymenobacter saemangeumensis]|uniref:Outer membrane protein beta-barrel domain-containing protein n=1 Tax=Hymenobacter saemangeumensis TaxID=1084522 RepID=A0ABP8IQQ1_9BACT
MKKLSLTLAALLATIGAASAQVEIGLKVSPAITSLRADSPTANRFQSESAQVGIGGGLVVDYFFGENYAFSTGLQLTGKGGSYSYQFKDAADNTITVADKLRIDYLELPLAVKLFTNEVATDIRLYFQVGGSVAVPIGARINGEKRWLDISGKETTALQRVFFIDANALAGLGVEYQLAKSTKAFVGLSYHRGLINLDSFFDDEREPKIKDVSIKNNVFALDFGLKF